MDTVTEGKRVIKFIRQEVVLDRLGVSSQTLKRMVKAGKFPPPLNQRTNNFPQWAESDLEDYQLAVLAARAAG